MVADAVGHRLNQHGAAVRNRELARCLGGGVPRGHVVAVHADRVHTVTDRARGDTICGGGLAGWWDGGMAGWQDGETAKHGRAMRMEMATTIMMRLMTTVGCSPPRYCSCVGVEMAYPLLRQKNTIGTSNVPAKLRAEVNGWVMDGR